MGTQNLGYSKFGSTFKIQNYPFYFLKFWEVEILVFKFVGTQNMWVLKSVDIMKIGGK